jgi:hypothetical protein
MDGTCPPPLGSELSGSRLPARSARRAAGQPLEVPASQFGDRLAVMAAFLKRSEEEQKAKRKRYNDVTNQRARERRLAARKAAAGR